MANSKMFVNNPYLAHDKHDFLYHFNLHTGDIDFPETFGDIQYVCCGGSADRMRRLSDHIKQELNTATSENVSKSERYCMFKVGPVLCVNHGIGIASLSVMLSEVLKLLYHSKCQDVTFFRIGTSGGLGIEPGTVVVSNKAVNGKLEEVHQQVVLGKEIRHPADLDQNLSKQIFQFAKQKDFPCVQGATMCCNDFYEGQGRLDGAFCEYNNEDKLNFLNDIRAKGVCNIEMEASCLAATLKRANVKCAIVCVTLLNRLEGDQITTPKETIVEWENRPGMIITAFIKEQIQNGK